MLGTDAVRLHRWSTDVPLETPRRTTRWSRAGRRASRCSTSPGAAALPPPRARVGPGVFVPRPETELLGRLGAGPRRSASSVPVVVDLCTGSGAIALAVADEVPEARVYAVELDPAAHGWALATWPAPASTCASVTWPRRSTTSRGRSTSWPQPAVHPAEAWESVAPEARDHDPALALWSGGDGLDAMRMVEPGPPGCCGPGAGRRSSTPTQQGEPRRGLRQHRPLDRRPRQPGSGQSPALRHRPPYNRRSLRCERSEPRNPGRLAGRYPPLVEVRAKRASKPRK